MRAPAPDLPCPVVAGDRLSDIRRPIRDKAPIIAPYAGLSRSATPKGNSAECNSAIRMTLWSAELYSAACDFG